MHSFIQGDEKSEKDFRLYISFLPGKNVNVVKIKVEMTGYISAAFNKNT